MVARLLILPSAAPPTPHFSSLSSGRGHLLTPARRASGGAMGRSSRRSAGYRFVVHIPGSSDPAWLGRVVRTAYGRRTPVPVLAV